ncbi:hypothetical protein I4F81_005257 [Pyropia yezoensis]|uniref:Uncharacterized protein n=1 Tax=Pyropia yezoensis TaxID=2788 RepID=A0ACC3BYB0_PYRYE|nr:hypothetical protein I4F81_005257 [Neopyropia yezoensis]
MGTGLGDPLDDADGHYDDGEDDGADESAGPDDDDGLRSGGCFEMEEDDEDNKSDSGAAASRSASFTRSYAAAVSRGARGRRGSFDPSAGGARDVDGRALEATAGPPLRLQFNLNGVDIPQDSSILQAVLRSSSGAIGGGGSGLSDFVAANTSTPAAVAVTDDEVDEVDDRTAAADCPDAAVAEASAVAAAVVASSCSGRAVPLLPPSAVAESYASARLDAKLMRQLSDPLALCGETIPAWCNVLARDSPFILSFETRRELFYSTALGVTRALHRLQTRADSQSASGTGSSGGGGTSYRGSISEARIGRIQRQKVRIRRSRLLESAVKVMQLYAAHKTVLEVEYFDEVGTGLGPTLEFYTLASRELQRSSYKLWRSEHIEASAVAKPPTGGSDAKPPPSGGRATGKGKGKRRSGAGGGAGGRRGAVTGRSAAHPGITALSDGRLLDLRLSPVFCALLRAEAAEMLASREQATAAGVNGKAEMATPDAAGAASAAGAGLAGNATAVGGSDAAAVGEAAGVASEEASATEAGAASSGQATALPLQQPMDPLGLQTLAQVDAQLAKSLSQLVGMLTAGDGDAIASLCLSFTVPGADDLELVPNGAQVEVGAHNVLAYVTAVVRTVLVDGVRRQVGAFLGGYAEVLDVASLLLFEPSEMELLLCGPSFEPWDREFLVRATRCDHGFSHESEAVGFLLRFLSELGGEDQRRFLLFATGSPALPVGGLLGLHPRLTIVKRTADGGRRADECLPTVSTCSSYLKLPQYTSYEILKERMQYAMMEGQGSFLLS